MTRSTVVYLVLGTFIVGAFGFQQWDGLHVRWCYKPEMDPDHCFQSVPLTTSDAILEGWHEVKAKGGCSNHGKFHGRRFIKGDDVALSPLYDRNGIIAGIQMNLRKDEIFAKPNPYKFDQVPDYLDNEINGHAVYSLTFYYVNPERICSVGRTKNELKKQGVGAGLWIQHGPNAREHNLIRAPLYRDSAIQRKWSENLCVPTMGHHNYYNVPSMTPTNCTVMRPAFLMYNNVGELHGYGGVGVGHASSRDFEHPDVPAVLTGLGEMTPECMKNFAVDPGYSNMHMFLVKNPRSITCQPVVQVSHSSDIYTSPNAKKWWYTD